MPSAVSPLSLPAARGADTLACRWAQDREVPAIVNEAEWAKLGRR